MAAVRRLFAGSFLVVAICLGVRAQADESPLSLTWTAPAECPTEADVAADVSRRIGASTNGKPVRARAVVKRRGEASWEVVLETQQEGAQGKRALGGPTCAAVASAAALILALTIDPQAAAQTAAEPPSSPSAPVSAPTSAPVPAPTSAPAAASPSPSALTPIPPHSSDSWEISLRTAPALGFGETPDAASAGLEIGVGAAFGLTSLEIESTTTFGTASRDAATRAGTGGSFRPFAVGIAVCRAFFDRRSLRVGGCAGFEYQRLDASSYGVTEPGSGSADWGAPIAAPFADFKLSRRVWIATRAIASVPLERPTFSLGHVGAVYRVEPLSVRASAGIEIRF